MLISLTVPVGSCLYTMSIPRLNYDVLLHILHIQVAQDKADAVPLMQTCRTLQQTGAPLLVQGRVKIRDVKAVVSFYRFMTADKTRFRYLRCLRLGTIHLSEDDRLDKALSFVFRHARELGELFVENLDFLNSYPTTSNAISKLTQLESVSFSFGNSREQANLRDMLKRFRSNLRVLSVIFWDDVRSGDIGDPIILLEGVATHLEALRVIYGTFASYEGPVFPRLKILSCADLGYMHACEPLIRAFPNLLWLEVPQWGQIEDPELDQRRLENQEAQQRLRWLQLSFLRGSVVSLYGLALQCPVTTLRLSFGNEEREAAMLPVVLRDTPPIHLVMYMDCNFPFAPSTFAGALSRLKDLSIEISLSMTGPHPQQLFVRSTILHLHLCKD